MDSLDFHEYVQRVKQVNLHPRQAAQLAVYTAAPLQNINHLIFYGPPGIGKYSQALHFISAFSGSELKYDKKITVDRDNPKPPHFKVRVSDIHYEVDMALLGCVSKSVWHTIFGQIVEIILTKPGKTGIILCRNFHGIHAELLDIFYSYMQNKCQSKCVIKFVFVTEAISFIPDSILNCSDIVAFSKPTKIAYTRILQNNVCTKDVPLPVPLRMIQQSVDTSTSPAISNIKLNQVACLIKSNDDKGTSLKTECDLLQTPHVFICKRLCNYLSDVESIEIVHVRNALYDILIYNVDLCECIWTLVQHAVSLLKANRDPNIGQKTSNIFGTTAQFFKLYNKNYRPIYHLEFIFFNLIDIVWKTD